MTTPIPASVDIAHKIVMQGIMEDPDPMQYDFINAITAALDQQIERDAVIAYNRKCGHKLGEAIAAAIRQQGER